MVQFLRGYLEVSWIVRENAITLHMRNCQITSGVRSGSAVRSLLNAAAHLSRLL